MIKALIENPQLDYEVLLEVISCLSCLAAGTKTTTATYCRCCYSYYYYYHYFYFYFYYQPVTTI